ncbi:nucleotide-binding universal stress UspA family protein [Lysobacter niabensis]|uniref:Nucleotide-binding universal stress UspA family protein n=1 Tax=Agrilutibacter niabensis TaxID=380628 RepID=A0ABU1VR44_9GAMM|nr:flagellar basal body-associated protein FliL [Lysobacter niabensis]MDR7099815.1 nucleotide-binding universal stress UspA family protein [Lysobacter niabensis]
MPKSATLLVIRHAEKSDDPDDTGLTPAGQARACAYVAYFQTLTLDSEQIAPPSWLIAKANEAESRRAVLTLEPLAAALGLPIDSELREEQTRELAQRLREEARYDGATTLVCWSHKHLPKLVKALGAPKALLPDDWPEDVFDWLLRLDYDAAGELASATRHEQRLMFGDCAASP